MACYSREWILDIEDVSTFVLEQRGNASPPYGLLMIPREANYPVVDREVAARLQLLESAPRS